MGGRVCALQVCSTVQRSMSNQQAHICTLNKLYSDGRASAALCMSCKHTSLLLLLHLEAPLCDRTSTTLTTGRSVFAGVTHALLSFISAFNTAPTTAAKSLQTVYLVCHCKTTQPTHTLSKRHPKPPNQRAFIEFSVYVLASMYVCCCC